MAAGKSAVSSNETDSKDSPANSATGAPPSSTTDLNFINLIPKRNFATTAANIKAIEKKQQRLAAKMEIKPVDADSVLDTFQDPSKNPYFDPSIKSKSAAAPKPRNQRVIKFNQRGKYIAQANQMRAAVKKKTKWGKGCVWPIYSLFQLTGIPSLSSFRLIWNDSNSKSPPLSNGRVWTWN